MTYQTRTIAAQLAKAKASLARGVTSLRILRRSGIGSRAWQAKPPAPPFKPGLKARWGRRFACLLIRQLALDGFGYTLISVRRFFSLPSGVELSAIGLLDPLPAVRMRLS